MVATTRDPKSFASEAAAIGPGITPTTLTEALKAEVIFLAVRFESHADVAKALPSWEGKIIIDVTNAYGTPSEKLKGLPASRFVAQAFTDGKLVKGFNHLIASILNQDPAVHSGRRVVFLASNDDDAVKEISSLRKSLDFHQTNLEAYRRADCLFKVSEIHGVN